MHIQNTTALLYRKEKNSSFPVFLYRFSTLACIMITERMIELAFKDRVREARKKAGYSQKQLAQAVGVSPQLVSFWESGKNSPNEQAIYKLMRLCSVDANFLYQDEMEAARSASAEEMGVVYKLRNLTEAERKLVLNLIDTLLDLNDELAPPTKADDDLELVSPPMFSLPYGFMTSAGSGDPVPEEVGSIRIKDTSKNRKADFVLKVDGHSMEPTYLDGDLLLIKSQSEVEEGQIGVWIVDGEAFVKQRKGKALHSLNPDYPDVPLTEFSDAACKGLVLDKVEM